MKAIEQLEQLIEETRTAAPANLGNSGPKSKPGKQRVALNGVTHGLTGQNVFLEAGEYPAYMALGAQYIAELRPVGIRETQLAQKIIDNNWRLNTIAAVENNLFNANLMASVRTDDPNDDKTVGMLAKAAAWRTDCEGPNAFEKIGRYEARLQRDQYKLTAELERFQAIRLRNSHDTFEQSECKAWIWYDRMLTLHTKLAAERVAETETGSVATAKSAASGGELLCKTTPATDGSDDFAEAVSAFYKKKKGLAGAKPFPNRTSNNREN